MVYIYISEREKKHTGKVRQRQKVYDIESIAYILEDEGRESRVPYPNAREFTSSRDLRTALAGANLFLGYSPHAYIYIYSPVVPFIFLLAQFQAPRIARSGAGF